MSAPDSQEPTTGSLTSNSEAPSSTTPAAPLVSEPSATSIDSETMLVNPSDEASNNLQQHIEPQDETSLKKCWICYADETEDTPTTSRWRSPCPCALVAHEACLLDWVADLEGSISRRREVKPIQCPQCKKDIVIARPKSYIVSFRKSVERLGSRLVVPGLLIAACSCVYTGATMHGISSTWMVLGRRDFERLVSTPTQRPTWWFVFPVIPFALVIARTPLADKILPTVPLLLYATKIPQNWGALENVQLWPPTIEMALGSLPFFRSVYRQSWKYLFAKKEAEWTKAIQPRANESTDLPEGADPAPADNGGGGGLDLFDFQVEIVDGDDEDAVVAEVGVGPAADNNAPNPAGAAPEPNRQRNQGLTMTGAYIADLIMGALAFPAISSLMGELLKLGLPKTWTASPLVLRIGSRQARPGFFQNQWARTLVGGCLFVVMKDTLTLYSKYRLAKDHKKRRICNYDKKSGRVVD